MRFLLLTFAAPFGAAPSNDKASSALDRFNRSLLEAGVLLGTDRLRPASGRVDISATTGAREATGYWLIQVRTLDEALTWAGRCPLTEGETIEVRQAVPLDARPLPSFPMENPQ